MSRTVEMSRTHYLHDDSVHYKWDTGNKPTMNIDSGDTVVVWTRDISDNQVSPDAEASVLTDFDWDRAYPLTGPIAVHGAEPGDTLKIDVLDIHIVALHAREGALDSGAAVPHAGAVDPACGLGSVLRRHGRGRRPLCRGAGCRASDDRPPH
ncbi:MAG: acetamidase/formamidase family protein [Solirubrobacteraceae bacterium]